MGYMLRCQCGDVLCGHFESPVVGDVQCAAAADMGLYTEPGSVGVVMCDGCFDYAMQVGGQQYSSVGYLSNGGE